MIEIDSRLLVTGSYSSWREVGVAIKGHRSDRLGDGTVPYLNCINTSLLVVMLSYRSARCCHRRNWEKKMESAFVLFLKTMCRSRTISNKKLNLKIIIIAQS